LEGVKGQFMTPSSASFKRKSSKRNVFIFYIIQMFLYFIYENVFVALI